MHEALRPVHVREKHNGSDEENKAVDVLPALKDGDSYC
jgi:hypothetical protein